MAFRLPSKCFAQNGEGAEAAFRRPGATHPQYAEGVAKAFHPRVDRPSLVWAAAVTASRPPIAPSASLPGPHVD